VDLHYHEKLYSEKLCQEKCMESFSLLHCDTMAYIGWTKFVYGESAI